MSEARGKDVWALLDEAQAEQRRIETERDQAIKERDGWKKRCEDETRLQVKYRELWEAAEAECQKERQRRVADQEACLRMGNQLCDWQTRAIEAERKLKER